MENEMKREAIIDNEVYEVDIFDSEGSSLLTAYITGLQSAEEYKQHQLAWFTQFGYTRAYAIITPK